MTPFPACPQVGHLEGRHSKRTQATDQCPEHMDRATAEYGSAASSQQIHLKHKPTNKRTTATMPGYDRQNYGMTLFGARSLAPE